MFSKPSKWPPTAHLDCCGGPVSGSVQCRGKPQCPKRYWTFWNAKMPFFILTSFLYISLNSFASPKEKGQKLTLISHWIHPSGSSLSSYFFLFFNLGTYYPGFLFIMHVMSPTGSLFIENSGTKICIRSRQH